MNDSETSRPAAEDRELCLGVDIGGTNIDVALVTSTGRIMDEDQLKWNSERSREGLYEEIERLLHTAFDVGMNQIDVIGVAVAGLVGREEGIVHLAPNIGWTNVPLAGEIEDHFSCPVQVCNDVDAATWGEWTYGAGRGVNDMVLAYIGTGFGTGVITGGHLLEGCRSSAAELGHFPIVADGRSCTSPHDGCIEAYASGWAIGERARDAVRNEPGRGAYLKEQAGAVEDITARHVSRGFHEGDDLSTELVEETGELLGTWAVGVSNVFHPKRLVLGGSVYEGIPAFRTWIENHIEEHAFEPHRAELEVTETELDDHAPVLGAAALSREHTA